MEKRFLYYIAGGVVLVFLAICIRLFTGEVLVAPGHTSSSEPVLPKVTPTVVPTDLPSVVHTDLATSTIAQNDTPYASFIRRITDDDQIGNSVVGIQFFGDIMLDRSVARMMGASGTAYVFEHLFGEYNGLDQRVDLTIANLEGPFAPTRVKTSKSIAFRFDPKFARELRDAGFDVVSLANNHTLDMGWKNVDLPIKHLMKQV